MSPQPIHARKVWPVLAVDPGGAETGLVVRDRDDLLHYEFVERRGDRLAYYLLRVLTAVSEAADALVPTTVAIEGLNPPSPHMGLASVHGLIDTATVLGAVLGQWPHALVVPPGGHGSAPLRAYPAALVGARERKGAGVLRHCRSSWDVAGAAVPLARLTGRAS